MQNTINLPKDQAIAIDLLDLIEKWCMPIIEEVYGKGIRLESDQVSNQVYAEVMSLIYDQLLPLFNLSYSEKIDYEKRTHSQQEIQALKESFLNFIDYHLNIIREEKMIKKYLPYELKIKIDLKPGSSPSNLLLELSNHHFFLRDSEGNKYHVKTAMNDIYCLNGSLLNEVFIYKLLEKLGYGPKVESIFVPEKEALYILSHDFSNNSIEKPYKKYNFYMACQDEIPLPKKHKNWEFHMVACNILVDLLQLADVYTNTRNFGLRVSYKKFKVQSNAQEDQIDKNQEGNEKIEKKIKRETQISEEVKAKAVLVDFHLALGRKALTVEEIIEKYLSRAYQVKDYQQWLFPNVPCILKDKEILTRVILRLRKGNKNCKLSFEQALQVAFDFTTLLEGEIKKSWQLKPTESASIEKKLNIFQVQKQKNIYSERWQALNKLLKLGSIID